MLIIDPIYGPFIRQDENPQRQVKGSLEKTVIGTTVISNSMHFLGLDMTWHDPQLYEAGRTVQKRNDGRNIGRAQPPPPPKTVYCRFRRGARVFSRGSHLSTYMKPR